MTTEERVLRLENAFASLSEMTAKVDSRTDTVVVMLRNHESRFDDHTDWINQLGSRMEELAAAQANSEHKIAAMTDAIIRLEEAQRRTDTKLDALAGAQLRTEDAMSWLATQMSALAGLVGGKS